MTGGSSNGWTAKLVALATILAVPLAGFGIWQAHEDAIAAIPQPKGPTPTPTVPSPPPTRPSPSPTSSPTARPPASHPRPSPPPTTGATTVPSRLYTVRLSTLIGASQEGHVVI